MDSVPFHETINIEKQAAVLLFLSHSNAKGIMTSKIFEYLGAGRPILSIPGDNNVTDALLKETGTGISASSPDELARIILSWYDEWQKKGAVTYKGRIDKIQKYTRRNQTRRMVQVLNAISDDIEE